MPQLGTSPQPVEREHLRLVEAVEQIAQAVDDHLVADDEDAIAPIFARQHVEKAAQAQDHVAPAFAAGRAKVELADVRPLLGELGIPGADAERRQPVEDAELLFAQPLVADAGDGADVAVGLVSVRAQCGEDAVAGLAGADVGRAEHDLRLLVARQGGEPVAERVALLLAERRQRHVDIAIGDIDRGKAAELGRVAGDVAGALAVADDPERLRPLLFQAVLGVSASRSGAATAVPRVARCRLAPCPAGAAGHRHPCGALHERRPLFARRPLGPDHRRLARHRPDDRRRLPQGRCPRRLHLVAQGRSVRRDRARAVGAGDLRLAAGRRLGRAGRASARRRLWTARVRARHPGEQRRRRLGRGLRHLPRKGLGQGRRPESEDAVLPHPGARRAAAQGGQRRRGRPR